MIEGSFDGCFSNEFGRYSLTTESVAEQIIINLSSIVNFIQIA
jgi:hypothetical protein